MNKFIKFTDAVTGHIYLPDNHQYIVTKDSTSKCGHSIVAQIQMTHAGIVTLNRGFYLPANMKAGTDSFTTNYNKPVLIGHDSDTDPVGRVIAAKYIDTSATYTAKDKFISNSINFIDGKKDPVKTVEVVQHIIKNYCGKDSYRGMGHILGTLKITDETTIQKILDERYLTVSTSMSSDMAICSECGQDWIAEGPCEHERGQTYDSGVPVVLIPGKQKYNHVGIVSQPADPHAAGFNVLEINTDGTDKKLDSVIGRDHVDSFSIAANLFSYNNSTLISLSDKKQTDLIEVKDNIQEIQDSLNRMEKQMSKKTLDCVKATVSLYSSEEGKEKAGEKIANYLKSLSAEDAEKLIAKAFSAIDAQEFSSEEEYEDSLKKLIESEVPVTTDATTTTEEPPAPPAPVMAKTKVLNEKFKLVDGAEYDVATVDAVLKEITEITDSGLTEIDAKELASIIVKARNNDALSLLVMEVTDKEIKDLVVAFKDFKAKQFKLSTAKEEEILSKMNDNLEESHKISNEAFAELKKTQFAGAGKTFPVTSKEVSVAAKKVLGTAVAADSLKARILGNIEKITSTFAEKPTEEKQTDGSAQENFDTTQPQCNNKTELSDEKVLEDLKGLLELADKKGIISDVIAPYLIDKNQEIEILEQQLELINDEFDRLSIEIERFKDEAKQRLVDQVVDARIKKGLVKVDQRDSQIAEFSARTEDSLRDTLKDLEGMAVTTQTQVEDNIATLPKVENPVLQDEKETPVIHVEKQGPKVKTAEELRDEQIQQKYALLRSRKGKTYADSWLEKQL